MTGQVDPEAMDAARERYVRAWAFARTTRPEVSWRSWEDLSPEEQGQWVAAVLRDMRIPENPAT